VRLDLLLKELADVQPELLVCVAEIHRREFRLGRRSGRFRYDSRALVRAGNPFGNFACLGVGLGSVIKKRRKKMRKHKHKKMLKKTRWARRAHA
jgi:hypothetical protein